MLLCRSYSHHSLLSALPQIPTLIKKAKEKGYTSIALTDEDTGSSLIEFYDECKKQEINPILGSTLRIPNLSLEGSGFSGNSEYSKISILAKNEAGYKSLIRLISLARTVNEKPNYHLTFKNIQTEFNSGNNFKLLINGNDHELIQAFRNGKPEIAQKIISSYLEYFKAENLLVELAYPLYNDNPLELKQLNLNLINLLTNHQIKYIASPASRYPEIEDEEAFKVVLAIRNQTRLDNIELNRSFHLPTKQELQSTFDYAPESMETQNLESEFDIQILTNYDKNADDAFFPAFALEPGQDADKRLTWESYIGLFTRYHPDRESKQFWKEKYPYTELDQLILEAKSIVPDPTKLLGYSTNYWETKSINDYIDRLDYELGIIIKKGYGQYFLVFGDIMNFCKENGIVTNTRGSAAGALVGYLLNINVLDPLIYNLPFERFLNPDRPSPPDIDGDFADDKRDLVIEYIRSKYGSEKVSQIITFGTMLPRAAVRDVGRVLGISYKKCDRLSKLMPIAPQGKKTTFAYAFETSSEVAEVYEKDEESKRIIDIAKKIEGNYRHASSHAAGVLIAPTNLTDYAPTQWDSEHKMMVAQYDMKVCEKVGLVKLDILGITNLAILGNAIELTQKRRNMEIDLLNINTYDKKSFELLAKGRTMGTFQLSSSGMTRYLVELEPTQVEDLMAMVALYRPGPMANIPEFIKRKKNPKKAKYFVPQMEKWMKPTFGILVYQEDLLQTAIDIAGFSWGEADTLRKGMGKKIAAVIESQHPKFVNGCVNHSGLTKEKAEEIWQAFLPFAAYGFNKSHSASYGMVAYWTAYMKSEYPVEFMTAYMTSESNNLVKIAEAINECKELGIQVLPPDINQSENNFSIVDDTTIRYGFGSIKNLGSDIIKIIIDERQTAGNFSDLNNLVQRIAEYPNFTKRSLEALILSGCLDTLGEKVLEKSG